PISRSLTTSCAGLELRLLPSTGITRLHRYYGPLRHPNAPGLSLTGVWLIIPDHAWGLPVLRALSLCTCRRHYPGAAAGRTLRSSRPAVSAFPERVVGSACASSFSRLARRSLALRPAHSRGHRIFVPATRRLQTFLLLHACSGCFRLERLPSGPCTNWKAPPCHGAHPQRSLTTDRATHRHRNPNLEVASLRTLPEPGLRRSAGHWRSARSTVLQAAASARAFRRITCGGCPKARRKARRMRSRSAKPVCRAMTSIGCRLCSIISRAASMRSDLVSSSSSAENCDWPPARR